MKLLRAKIIVKAKDKHTARQTAMAIFRKKGKDFTINCGYTNSSEFYKGVYVVSIYDVYIMEQIGFLDYVKSQIRRAKTAIRGYFGIKPIIIIAE